MEAVLAMILLKSAVFCYFTIISGTVAMVIHVADVHDVIDKALIGRSRNLGACTTHCMHSSQTLFLRRLEGLACETILQLFLYSNKVHHM